MDFDQHLAQLLGSMTLQNAWTLVPDVVSLHHRSPPMHRPLTHISPHIRPAPPPVRRTPPLRRRTPACPTAHPTPRTPRTKHVLRPRSSSRRPYLPLTTLTCSSRPKPPPSRAKPARSASAPVASPASSPSGDAAAPRGCGLLQAIRAQLTSDRFPTTGGEYLEAIFTHREVVNAFPPGHRDCAVGFTELASCIEKRAWRADRDSDYEAVAAFRNEAWVLAHMSGW